MDLVSDILLAGAAIGAAVFCLVLSRRLRALTALDSGMGSAIAVLSRQVDDLTRALRAAQETANRTAERLESQSRRAETAHRQLELLLAAMHDLPETPQAGFPPSPGEAPAASPAVPLPASTKETQSPLSRWEPAARRRPTGAPTAESTPVAPAARVLRRRPPAGEPR